MKLWIIIAVLFLCACAHSPIAVHPDPVPPIEGTGAVAAITPEPASVAEPNTPPPGADISDDPDLGFIVRLVGKVAHDAGVAKQIAGPANDKIMLACATLLADPGFQQRAVALFNLKGTIQFTDVKPAGFLSALAYKRAIAEDIASGALADRLRAKRKELRDLKVDFRMSCSALFVDEVDLFGKARRLIGGAL